MDGAGVGTGPWRPYGSLDPGGRPAGQRARQRPHRGADARARRARAASRILLSGLTSPQGLAFARRGGRWVLYVGESDQIDRYPWGPGGISGPARSSPPACPTLTRPATTSTGRKTSRSPRTARSTSTSAARRTPVPVTGPCRRQRAVIMAVSPDGHDLRVVETRGAQRRGPGGGPRRLGVDRGERARQRDLPVPLVLCRARRRLRAGHPGLRQ